MLMTRRIRRLNVLRPHGADKIPVTTAAPAAGDIARLVSELAPLRAPALAEAAQP
jgi:hypothetical protein